MVREMVGGCCVCLDERGWNENPLVYCDGSGCSVAVHQACYGIVKVPTGPWFCCKCRSQERVARVKCELCPNKGGALKRTESGGWAHVVCALYIPEVRFGDVSTMEPIIFSSVPNERFVRTCFICEEDGRESIRSVNGACMNCHKSGCKLSFHVTCAQSRRLLCEEASVNGHVQYVGYCTIHWSKRFKQQPPPPPSPSSQLTQTLDEKKTVKEKAKARTRNDSTSSTNSVDVPKTRGRKKNSDVSPDARKRSSSPAKGEENIGTSSKHFDTNIGKNKAAVPLFQAKAPENQNSLVAGSKASSEKLKGSSPLNTPVPKNEMKSDEAFSNSRSFENKSKNEAKKRKLVEEEKVQKRQKVKNEKVEVKDKKKKIKSSDDSKKEKKFSNKDKEKSSSDKRQKFPVPSKLGLVENGKVSSWESVTPKYTEPPDNFQDFLEHQWNQSAHFITSKAEHFDVASLLACLHQLKSDNTKLEKKLMNIQARRDRLLGVNARLAASFTENDEEACNGRSPLSAMLSKLNDKSTTSPKDKLERSKVSPHSKSTKKKRPVASPDLAMLAAASVKLESETMTRIEENDETNSDSEVPSDEQRPSLLNDDTVNSMLVQPSITSRADSMIDSSLDRLLAGQRHAYNHASLFADNPASSSSSSP